MTQMCEEIKNASTIVPRSIMMSVAINGTLGFTMMIAIFYCIGDVNAALNTATDYPFMEIFVQATDSVAAAAILASLITIMQMCAVVANLASASRMHWSFCRDRAVPGWMFFSKVRMGQYEFWFPFSRKNQTISTLCSSIVPAAILKRVRPTIYTSR